MEYAVGLTIGVVFGSAIAFILGYAFGEAAKQAVADLAVDDAAAATREAERLRAETLDNRALRKQYQQDGVELERLRAEVARLRPLARAVPIAPTEGVRP
jgi:hypothetical protein